MAHFAKLGAGNIVLTVEVVSNDIATTEKAGEDFLNKVGQIGLKSSELIEYIRQRINT